MQGLELDFIEWLRGQASPHEKVSLGIGDDMAILGEGGGRILISSDMLLDGVHFDSRRHAPGQIGRKAIACSLSDCAAMAVRPLAATVSVAFPNEFGLDAARALFSGMLEVASEYELAVVGGDTTCWSHPLALDVAVYAEPYADVRPVTRGGARPGDQLYVTGTLGGSILGHHLSFTPRVEEARQLASSLGPHLHALIDVTDGLALDLWRMCTASGVGAVLDHEQLQSVISDDARQLARQDRRSALRHALEDGEDFELLFAAEGAVEGCSVAVFPIGSIRPSGLSLAFSDGHRETLEPRGFVH